MNAMEELLSSISVWDNEAAAKIAQLYVFMRLCASWFQSSTHSFYCSLFSWGWVIKDGCYTYYSSTRDE